MRRAVLAVSLIVLVFLMFGRQMESSAPTHNADEAPGLVSVVSP